MSVEDTPDIIADAHQDIAYNHALFGREHRRPAWVTRRGEDNSPQAVKWRGVAANGLPDALLGRIGVVIGTLYVAPAWSKFARPPYCYHTPQEAYQFMMGQMDYYHRLADEDPRVQLIRTQGDLDAVLATWQPGTDFSDHRQGIMVSMEGADGILEPAQVEDWYERGLRSVGPAWSETRYAGGTGRPGPLTDLGRELLERMADLGMLLDLSHLTDEGFLEAVDRYDGPLIASHSNPRYFVDSERMLSDLMIERLAERDGVMGIIPLNNFLKKGWTVSDPPLGLEVVVAAIDYVCQLTGSARYVGLGSDIDGGYGTETMPAELDTATDLWQLKDALAQRGYAPEDVRAILCSNVLRKMRECLPG